jgi:peptide methionine sulfoxide reductase MsrB
VRCTACDAHLGSRLSRSPAADRLRYCINVTTIDFTERTAEKLQK